MGSATTSTFCATIIKDQVLSAGGLAMNIASFGGTGSVQAA